MIILNSQIIFTLLRKKQHDVKMAGSMLIPFLFVCYAFKLFPPFQGWQIVKSSDYFLNRESWNDGT